MDQWCTKDCCPAKCCCDTRDDLKFYFRIIYANFIHKACHTVNTGISTADHGNNFAFHCFLKCQNAAVNFFFHWCGQEFFVRKCVFDKIYIDGISDDRITFFQSFHCYTGHLVTASRSDSYNIYFIQNVPPISGVPELASRPLSRSFF